MRELRIGLVLYGGVSLAVYMNGIVTELWQALRASQALRAAEAKGRAGALDLDGTARLYADLFKALDGSSEAESIRVVVDALSGTSAGGVNAAVLGKAIVQGGDARVLNDIWLDQADIAKLQAPAALRTLFALRAGLWTLKWIGPLRALRHTLAGYGLDARWARDQVWSLIKSANGRATPLDGAYFARKIAEALGALKGTPPLLPAAARLDLFLTRTDFYGWPRHLPVSETYHPNALYERTHAHVMSFQAKAREPLDDYALTYAARTTAGFPAAFAPVATEDMRKSYVAGQPDAASPDLGRFAATHLSEHVLAGFDPGHAWMVDGGVLDNKPFTQLARAIERKPADREVRRVVAFIEPDPEITIEKPPGEPPAPMQVVKGMYGLLRHEPIYDDLDRMRDRNAQVWRIRAAIDAERANADRAVEAALGRTIADIAQSPPPDEVQLTAWRKRINGYAATQPLSGYPGYVSLKLDHALRVLATLLCNALGFPYPSSQAFFVRRLTRLWVERRGLLAAPALSGDGYVLTPDQLALLDAFDIPFRLRRLRHIVRAANANYEGADRDTRAAIDGLKSSLAEVAAANEALLDAPQAIKGEILAAFGGVRPENINEAIAGLKRQPEPALARFAIPIETTYEAIRTSLAGHGSKLSADTEAALAKTLHTLGGRARQGLLHAYLGFPFVDLIAFPLMDAAELEDLITVEVMRIAPADAVSLSTNPFRLKSREVGAFKGFLDRHAREHDLMWGRLDGAERLIDLFVKAASKTKDQALPEGLRAIADRFRREIMSAILAEERARPGNTLGPVIDDLETLLRHQ